MIDIKIHCAHTEVVDPATLVPNPRNPNQHPKKQIELLAKIIKSQGWRAPVTVSNRSGFIVRGHGRQEAALLIGCMVPIDRQDYESEADEWADLIADNRLAELSEIDDTLLAELLAEIGATETDLTLTGYSTKQIDNLLANLPQEEVHDDNFDAVAAAEEAAQAPRSKRGDIWQLGHHRLMCGDSTVKDDVEALMSGELAEMVFTDPPYNVAYEGGTKDKLKIQNDNMPMAEFQKFLTLAFSCMYSSVKPGGAIYVCHADSAGGDFRTALLGAGWSIRQCLVWVKNQLVIGKSDYQWQHEPCQPAGTMVRTPIGEVPIENLKDGDTVVSYDKYSGTIKGMREGCKIKVAKRQYAGTLYGVNVGSMQTWATDAHRFTIRFRDCKRKTYCTYLMRCGNWWRVGVTETYNARGFGLKTRYRQEHAEEAWIINTFNSKLEALCYEQILAVKYGIPLTHWNVDRGFSKEHAPTRTEEMINKIYENLDLVKMEERARNLLLDFGRRIEHPLINSYTASEKFSCRVTAQIRACNLIPNIMEIPIPYKTWDTKNNKTFDWQVISAIELKQYSGVVYSLDVEKYSHYIADGIITHNCLYGWRPGAAHRWYGGRKQSTTIDNDLPVVLQDETDGTKLISVTVGLQQLVLRVPSYEIVSAGDDAVTSIWRFEKPVRNGEHPTMKPIPLCARAIQNSSRPHEIVLELFGGSGSTLMAAEQVGRVCYCMELDPIYVDVIIRRWEQYTGQEAKLLTKDT